MLIVLHLAAMACGVGAAVRIDIGVARALRSQQVDGVTLRLVQRMSIIIWVSVAMLIGSGFALLLTGSPPTSRLFTKLVVVTVACTNGALVHQTLVPELRRLADLAQASSLPRSVVERAGSAAAVSVLSWVAAIVLGSWRSLTLGVPALVSIYLVTVVMAAKVGGRCAAWLCPSSDSVDRVLVGVSSGSSQ